MKFTANQFKKAVKSAFPPGLLEKIQRFRARNHQHPQWVQDCEKQHRLLNQDLPADEFVFRPGIRLKIDPESRVGFEYFCFTSPDMIHEFDLFLDEIKGKKRLLDVGAFHGVFSLAFTLNRLDCQALAVDASPSAFAVLNENIRLNPQLNIKAVNAAVGDQPGHIRMKKVGQHYQAVDGAGKRGEDCVDVSITTIDDVLQSSDFQPDLIKIDVEGYELQAIRGAMKTLLKKPVDLLVEIHPDFIADLKYSISELTDELVKLGYHFYDIGPERRRLTKAEIDDKIHVTWVMCKV